MAEYIGGGVATPTVDSGLPTNTVHEVPAPVQQMQPPASNSGSDDPTGGIAQDAGGLSSTAHIGSPVTSEHEQQTLVGSVLEYAFGKKEREAVSVDAAHPTSSTVTANTQPSSTSNTYLGAIAGAGAAAGAAVASVIPGMASTSGAEPGAHSSVTTESTVRSTDASTSTGLTESTASSTYPGSSSWTADDKTLGEKAAETTESAKQSAAETAESAKQTANETAQAASDKISAAKEDTKEAVADEKSKEQDGEENKKSKQVSDHEAAIRENKDAIPTAGGEKLGAAHAGESKVIPDNPKPADREDAGQPDLATAENTKQNSGGPSKNRAELLGQTPEEAGSDKPKLMDRLKHKLHMDKKDKA